MKQIQVHGQSPESSETTLTRTCSDDLEPGYYFFDQGGYVRLSEFTILYSAPKVHILLPYRRFGLIYIFKRKYTKLTRAI